VYKTAAVRVKIPQELYATVDIFGIAKKKHEGNTPTWIRDDNVGVHTLRAFRYARTYNIHVHVHYIWIIYIHKCQRAWCHSRYRWSSTSDAGQVDASVEIAADSVFNSNSTLQSWSYAQINNGKIKLLTLFSVAQFNRCIGKAKDVQLRKNLKKRSRNNSSLAAWIFLVTQGHTKY